VKESRERRKGKKKENREIISNSTSLRTEISALMTKKRKERERGGEREREREREKVEGKIPFRFFFHAFAASTYASISDF
jgi:hypothetical protein